MIVSKCVELEFFQENKSRLGVRFKAQIKKEDAPAVREAHPLFAKS